MIEKTAFKEKPTRQIEVEYRVERTLTDIAPKSYGIAFYVQGRELRRVDDITTDRAALTKLVELCNREKLSSCHLHDIIDDFLGCIYGEEF